MKKKMFIELLHIMLKSLSLHIRLEPSNTQRDYTMITDIIEYLQPVDQCLPYLNLSRNEHICY